MKRSQIDPMPQFFDLYINLVEDVELEEAFQISLDDILNYDFASLEKLGNQVYAPNKWTVKDIFQHLIDNERIQSYRALRFGRNDVTVLAGYDEQILATYANANKRSIQDLKEEFVLVRKSTISLFRNMDDEALQRVGVAFKIEITPLGLGFQIIGHQQHHFNVIKERYLPLLG